MYTLFNGNFLGVCISSIAMADNSHARIVGKYALKFLCSKGSAISNAYLTGVNRAANTDATTVMD
jgi:hypothetical protein